MPNPVISSGRTRLIPPEEDRTRHQICLSMEGFYPIGSFSYRRPFPLEVRFSLSLHRSWSFSFYVYWFCFAIFSLEGNSRAKGKSGSKSATLDRKKIASSSGTKQSNGYAIGYEYPSAPNQVFLTWFTVLSSFSLLYSFVLYVEFSFPIKCFLFFNCF